MHVKRVFLKDQIYHICNKTISNYSVFQKKEEASRFTNVAAFYNTLYPTISFSNYYKNREIDDKNLLESSLHPICRILAYCVMPDHYHFLVKIIEAAKFSNYISNFENSFSHYINLRRKRKGPLWQNRFRSVQVLSNEQLLHLSRYIHLNPVTSNLVDRPEDWEFSSYRQYIRKENSVLKVTLEISISNPKSYRRFVDDQINYQKTLREIKKVLLE